MARATASFFQDHSTPLTERVAGGPHKIGLALKHQDWRAAHEEGLSPTQGQILVLLSDGEPLSGSELAAKRGVSLPTVSDSVRARVDKALVSKKPDPRHPRASLIELTAEGARAARRAGGWPEFLAGAVSTMSVAEQTAFLTGLITMIRTLQENGQINPQKMCISCVHFRPFVHAGERPHHCGFVDAPMRAEHLRLDCAEHAPATDPEALATWTRFLAPP